MTASVVRRQFLENCEDIVRRQSDVTIDDAALKAFAKTIQAANFVPDWKEYISDAANSAENYDFKRAFYEFAMITAQQGGFIYEDAEGQAQKWQKNGSGAKAMVEKFAEIRVAGALPFYDIGAEDIDRRLRPLLSEVPFTEQRLSILKEFAAPATHDKVMQLLDSVYDGAQYKLDMFFLDKLAQILPQGLGDDPFMKKNMLTALMAAANAHHHGVKVDTSDLLPAADYILPQVLNADHIGILKFSEGLTEKLEKRQGLDENAKEVEALRAATIVVCHRLMEESQLSAQAVDGTLWLAGRGLKNARPHMMCYTMRF